MSIVQCDSDCEDVPTLNEVKHEISNIVGLSEVKKQLEAIAQKIIDAEKDASDGFRVVPPKPFHMVFVGNNGTEFEKTIAYWILKEGKLKKPIKITSQGKSTVARILGKLFYLAGVTPSYFVTEIQGNQKMKDTGGGGVLVVNIEDPINSMTFDEIIDVMDEGETAVIFAGHYKALNQCMKLNAELYRRFAARLQFDDLTPLELATLLQKKASNKGEKDLISGLELDSSCIICNIAQIIADVTPEDLRRQLNAHLLDQMLIEAMKVANKQGVKTISLTDLGIGIQNGAEIYKNLLNL